MTFEGFVAVHFADTVPVTSLDWIRRNMHKEKRSLTRFGQPTFKNLSRAAKRMASEKTIKRGSRVSSLHSTQNI